MRMSTFGKTRSRLPGKDSSRNCINDSSLQKASAAVGLAWAMEGGQTAPADADSIGGYAPRRRWQHHGRSTFSVAPQQNFRFRRHS